MSTTVTYQGKVITTFNNGTKTLLTSGKWAEDDILISEQEEDPIFSASPAANITQTNITNWNNKSDFSGSYNDLTDKPTITGQVNSDWNANSGVAKILNKPTFTGVAISGDYNDLINKPTLDTALSTVSTNAVQNKVVSEALNEKASKQYVDTAISNIPSPMVFKGTLGTNGTVTTIPIAAAANTGFTYKVITAGTYASQTAKIGDVFISDGSNWILIPAGDDVSNVVVTPVQTSGTKIATITVDSTNTDLYAPTPTTTDATTSTHGLLTAADKIKLNNLNYVKDGTNESILLGDISNNIAFGQFSIAEGTGTEASKSYSHAEGQRTIASGQAAHAEGKSTKASGQAAHAEGYNTKASGYASHAEGCAIASEFYSHAEGDGTTASGYASHTEGYTTEASGYASHAEGYETTAVGQGAHAEGGETEAIGDYSHAEGKRTTASGSMTHAEGKRTTASGQAAHTEGQETQAVGDYSHAQGNYTVASGQSQHVFGEYNIIDSSTTDNTRGNYIEIVGNGETATTRSNARTLDWNGNAEHAGDVIAYGCGGSNPISMNLMNVTLSQLGDIILVPPSTNGTYMLTVNVSDDGPVYQWKKLLNAEGGFF